MNQVKPFLPWTFRILLSFLFLFSAYAKLYPNPSLNFAIVTFEMKQLVPLGFSECIAPYFSRFIIGAEIALGLGFLQPHFLRKLVIPLSALLLVVFNIHLLYSMITEVGGNCGCFGDLLPMTPTQAFLKNLVTLGIIAWLWFLIKDSQAQFKHNFFIPVSIALGSILFMFILLPFCPCKGKEVTPDNDEPNNSKVVIFPDGDNPDDTVNIIQPTVPEIVETPKNTYEPPKTKSGYAKYAPNIDEGKKLLLFFAPGCEHCQKTAKTLVSMSRKDKDFPKMFIIFMEEEVEKIPDFFEIAGKQISYTTLDVGSFWGLVGSRDTPGVLYLWNGNQVVFFDGINANEFEEGKLKKALKKERL